ncbi:glucosaminidase domain-containing protein [Paenibacillus sp. GP183]|uniref:glucosaminidase domain-containing protein n=1 Tax=Paenibacillus sp. GP183 TaxID=1882751 RepID=UPI0008989762|nr:glucosaminidase domain-containing protein [Paenibacillus sp. GP183]SEB49750.1 SH3 domain-containing protein [Paenibacillus sp. GP183]
MRNKLKNQIFAFILCVTVLCTMGFGIDNRINNHPENVSKPSVEIDSKEQAADYNKLSIIQPDTDTVVPLNSSAPESHPVQMTEEQRSTTDLTNTTVPEAKYEVTAYYLNVRENADVTSNILHEVTKGSILEVLEATSNGWLKLKIGGYVNANYAKLYNGDVKQSAPVNQLSVEQTTVKNAVGQASQPASNIKTAGPSKPTSSVKSESGLTVEHIAKIFEGTDLEGQDLERAILENEQEYGINAFFTIAVMKLESGHGKSQLAKTKNNLFGLNAVDSDAYNQALSFKTKEEGIRKFGNIISEFYIDKGLTSVDKVAGKYCAANSNWPALVKNIMNSDYKKLL